MIAEPQIDRTSGSSRTSKIVFGLHGVEWRRVCKEGGQYVEGRSPSIDHQPG